MNARSPAFPHDSNTPRHLEKEGLTKREYIAAAAMQGMIACPSSWPERAPKPELVAYWAVSYADALLAELEGRE